MECFKQYIVTKRFKGKSICGDVNLPFGTVCHVENETICCEKGEICLVTSQNAYDFFTQNDDGCAELRRELITKILDTLKSFEYDEEIYTTKWDKIWNDTLCQRYKREDYDDCWLWNYDFYNADIVSLQYIAGLVGASF